MVELYLGNSGRVGLGCLDGSLDSGNREKRARAEMAQAQIKLGLFTPVEQMIIRSTDIR